MTPFHLACAPLRSESWCRLRLPRFGCCIHSLRPVAFLLHSFFPQRRSAADLCAGALSGFLFTCGRAVHLRDIRSSVCCLSALLLLYAL
jgi:hypothetical protein